MSDTFYSQIAQWYDLEFDDFDADHELYLGYAGVVGSPVLELGCGTGRLLIPLAQAGHLVTGVDSSAAMVDAARNRLQRDDIAGVKVQQDDIRDLSDFPERHFRLVFSAINSFLHLHTRTDQLAALSAIRRILHEDGILVLDLFNPTPASLVSMDDRLSLDGPWTPASGERIDRITQRRINTTEQIIETSHFYDRIASDGTVHRTASEYTMRYIHRFEMEGLLDQAGFEMEGVYGSYSLDPLDDSSHIMIFVAHRRS